MTIGLFPLSDRQPVFSPVADNKAEVDTARTAAAFWNCRLKVRRDDQGGNPWKGRSRSAESSDADAAPHKFRKNQNSSHMPHVEEKELCLKTVSKFLKWHD
ncbi:hypothetical protein [Rhizobium freirei]|nr:hypothetical protein [Rhizobium freirei]